MSEPSSVGPEKSSPPKKPISPARNIIGLVILAAVLVVCWFEYSAVLGFNAAVKALEARTQNEEQGLATVAEAETLLGKAADGPAEDFNDGTWNFDKKTYTWKGLLKQHTLTAYYTKEQDSRLHHFETEGTKYDLQANQPPVVVAPTGGGALLPKGQGGRGGGRTRRWCRRNRRPALTRKARTPSQAARQPRRRPNRATRLERPNPSRATRLERPS